MATPYQRTFVATEVTLTELEDEGCVSVVIKNGEQSTLYKVVPGLSIKDRQVTAMVLVQRHI